MSEAASASAPSNSQLLWTVRAWSAGADVCRGERTRPHVFGRGLVAPEAGRIARTTRRNAVSQCMLAHLPMRAGHVGRTEYPTSRILLHVSK
jgi:hypothetical protein